jgi:hypothetical protein
VKALLRGMFVSAYFKKKTETSQINNLMMHLKLPEKQEQTKAKSDRWREIIKIRANISETENKQTMQKINEKKSWFFEKINKIDNSLANMTKQRREKTQINKIRDEKWDITINTDEIQRIIREYFENLQSSKSKNLDEVDKFLDAYKQPKLNQEDINHLLVLLHAMKLKFFSEMNLLFLQRRAQGLMESWMNFTKPLKN